MGRITRITLHHTDEHPGMRGKADGDVVRAIQRYHQETQGWADIGYHYLVGTDGRIYEGRAASVQGAHSGGANNVGNLGVSVIGNFSSHMPSRRQMEALGAFLEDRRAALGLPGAALYGHRDLGSTECPGSALYGWLQQLKRA
jgi:N-acetylmuramoyl-L-alanine amidase